jgi:hypothetical protein
MPIADIVFSSPIDIPALLAEGAKQKAPADCVDSLFINFMFYAKAHWSYIASARAGGEALLAGTETQVPCGGIANALKILIEEKLHLHVDYITIPGYVWTEASFLCFDSKVKGNVTKIESPAMFTEGCIFNEHYFLKCGGKFYDPCLNSTYSMQNEAVRKTFTVAEIIAKGRIMAGEGGNSVLIFDGDVVVPGWQRGAWRIVKANDLLRHIVDKNELMMISIKSSNRLLVDPARKASRKMFVAAGRLTFWETEHNRAVIPL